jgi:hypothetical protein
MRVGLDSLLMVTVRYLYYSALLILPAQSLKFLKLSAILLTPSEDHGLYLTSMEKYCLVSDRRVQCRLEDITWPG